MKNELKAILRLQTEDNVRAVEIDEQMNKVKIEPSTVEQIRSQAKKL